MLGKLMKVEFRATARSILPLYLVIAVLSVGVAFLSDSLDTESAVLSILSGLVVFGYAMALLASFVMVFVLMIERFRKNLLSDEGYVMFTLPVSVHQLLWSKIIASCLWFLATLAVACISTLPLFLASGGLGDIMDTLRQLFSMLHLLTLEHGINLTAFLLEGLLLSFSAYALGCLMIYFSIAAGYGFDRRKGLYAILIFFGVWILLQMVLGTVALGMDYGSYMIYMENSLGELGAFHSMMWQAIAVNAVLAALFYLGTTWMLKHRLNLE